MTAKSAKTVTWDGHRLHGDERLRRAVVLVPARLVAFASFQLPPGEPAMLKAAVDLRAQRQFAAVQPARIDAVIGSPEDGHCAAVAMALPEQQLSAINAAAAARRLHIIAITVAECQGPIPAGGLVHHDGHSSLVVCSAAGNCSAITVIGPSAAPDHDQQLERLRLALGETPCHAHPGPIGAIDFLRPSLRLRIGFWARPRNRLIALVAAVVVLVIGGLLLSLLDLVDERNALRDRLATTAPQVDALQAQRAEMRALAPWFDERSDPEPALAALTAALAVHDGSAQVYLTRFRQHDAHQHSAEGVGVSRDAIMAFVARLRAQQTVSEVAIRNMSGGDGERLAFEIQIVLGRQGAAHADS